MSVIDRAKAHFESISAPREIPIPEWGDDGKPFMIYVTPLSLGQKRKLFKLAQDGDVGFMVDLLIMKAKDAEGEPIFDKGDRLDLMYRTDPAIIERVAAAIPGTDLESADEDALKN